MSGPGINLAVVILLLMLTMKMALSQDHYYFNPYVSKVTFIEGSEAYLSCPINDISYGKVQWFFHKQGTHRTIPIDKGERVTGDGRFLFHMNTLHIRNVEKTDQGLYYCQGKQHNEIHKLYLKVKDKSRPAFVNELKDTSVAFGETAEFECRVKNLMQYKVTWSRMNPMKILSINGFMMSQNQRHEIQNVHYKEDSSNSWILRIKNANLSDIGRYECWVNTKPFLKQGGYLEVLVAPSVVKIEAPNEVKVGEVITISCIAENSNPPANVSIVINGYILQEVMSTTQKLDNGGWNTVTYITNYEIKRINSDLRVHCSALNKDLEQTKRDTVIINVIRPPGQPTISGYETGVSLRKGDPLRLTCISTGGNPLATLTWYKDNEKFQTDTRHEGESAISELNFSLTESDNEAEYRCEATNSATREPLVTSTVLSVMFAPSVVKIEAPEEVKVGDVITVSCMAENSNPSADVSIVINGYILPEVISRRQKLDNGGWNTVTNVTNYEIQRMNSDLRVKCLALNKDLEETKKDTMMINVIRPPGQPTISGYETEVNLRKGDPLRLTCISTGGNPLATLTWYKDNEKFQTDTRHEGESAISELNFSLTESDNEAEYRCKATNSATREPLVTSTVLSVMFAPSVVKIDAPEEVKVGDVITVSCMAENSNPSADVSIVINGYILPEVISRRQKLDNGGWNTVTNVTNYEIQRMNSDLRVKCLALNKDLEQTKIDTMMINVIRPPGQPTISGYETGVSLRKGDPLRLTCISTGGNPLATLTWYKDNEKFQTDTRHEGESAISELNFSLTESDNEAEYRCKATNSATREPLVTSTVLSVMFPPASVKLKVDPYPVRANTEISLVCESLSSNPVANVTWWRDGSEVGIGTVEVNPGQYGGAITKHSVRVYVTAEDNGAVFTCKADNGFGTTSHAVRLEVKYEDYFISYMYNVTFFEEGLAALSCPIDNLSNGKKVQWFFRKQGENKKILISNGKRVTDDPRFSEYFFNHTSTLYIIDVEKPDQGLYYCQVKEQLEIQFFLEVIDKRKPHFLGEVRNSSIAVGETANFSCSVKDLMNYEVTWHHINPQYILSVNGDKKSEDPRHEIQEIQHKEDRNNTYILRINNATLSDSGNYECWVNTRPVIQQGGYLEVTEKEPCSLSGMYVKWQTIKDQLNIQRKLRHSFERELLNRSESETQGIVINVCPSRTSCQNDESKCAPTSFESRLLSIPITVENSQYLLSIFYQEIKNCTCKKSNGALYRFPIKIASITKVIPKFFPPSPFWVNLKKILEILKLQGSVVDPETWRTLENLSEKCSKSIKMTTCIADSTICEGSRSKATSVVLERRASLPCTDRNTTETKLVIIDFVEASNCFCSESQGQAMPYVRNVTKAVPCPFSGENVKYGADKMAYAFCDRTLSFPWDSSTNRTLSIMVSREKKPSEPLIKDYEGLRNDFVGITSKGHWASNAGLSVDNGSVSLQLKNLTSEHQDSYFFSMELKNSPVCFVEANLTIIEKPTGCGCHELCYIKELSLDWQTFREGVYNLSYLPPALAQAELNETFSLQKCVSDILPYKDVECPQKSCFPSDFRLKTHEVCVPDGENAKSKFRIEYKEDNSCTCSPGSESNKDDGTHQKIHPIYIERVVEDGKCPRKCHPVTMKVRWDVIRKRINKYSDYSIQSFTRGKSMKVKVCPQFATGESTECSENGLVCDLVGVEKVKKKIKLKGADRRLIIKFLQAKECTCRKPDEVKFYSSSNKTLYYPFSIIYIKTQII